QIHERDLAGYLQARRPFVPYELAAYDIVARGQAQRRRAVAIQHGRRRGAVLHLLRPRLSTAGQINPAFRIHVHGELELRAGLVDDQRQPSRPGALMRVITTAVLRGQQRTCALLLAVQHPALPVAELRRDRDIVGGEYTDGNHAQKREHPQGTAHDCSPRLALAGSVPARASTRWPRWNPSSVRPRR